MLDVQLAPTLPRTEADTGQVRQSLLNLITNAAEAIGDRAGTITVATGAQDCDEPYLLQGRVEETPPPGRFVYLEVIDDGCGMDEVTLQRVFDPFFSTKFTGRGLGMAAVLGIVRGHHGTIVLSSRVGQGTTVRVLLPVASPQRQPHWGISAGPTQ
jgi:signal transduction histidine kinase